MKKTVVGISLLLLGWGGLAAFETTKNLSLPTQGVQRFEIDAGAGSLTVTGRAGLSAIEVKAEIVAKHVRNEDMDRYIGDRVELTLVKQGDAVVLVSRIRNKFRLFGFDDDAVINLTVLVPKDIPVDIDDGSGSMVAADLAAVRIEDGSGSIRVDHIAGDVQIDDGSGEIEVEEVAGNVSIDDGSGSILIRRIGGTVKIDDSSGSIDIDDVEKDVRLVRTGSGGVDVSNVKGRVVRND
jgi:DUF4097 and DUF4098 domain-containing protein YvlB